MNIRGLINYSEPLVAASTVIAIAIALAAMIAGYTAYSIKVAGDTISVTGSAKQSVTADFARWSISLEAKTGMNNQQDGLNRLETAKDKIVKYLSDQGISDIETPIASSYPEYTYVEKERPIQMGYNVNRQIIIRGSDIDKIADLAGNLTPFSGSGYTVTSNGLELTVQKLPDIRVDLLSDAIADARARAEAIAEETGRSVGALRSAQSGVVQVLSQGGIDVSDYGSYDTQSKQKEVMVTVRADFAIR